MSHCIAEEHELPQVEAVLAGTLALMTGYSQSLLAELHPEHRVLMGRKIGNNLALLADHPLLSPAFQTMLNGLQRRWSQMAGCSAEAACGCPAATGTPYPKAVVAAPCAEKRPSGADQPFVCEAPPQLQ